MDLDVIIYTSFQLFSDFSCYLNLPIELNRVRNIHLYSHFLSYRLQIDSKLKNSIKTYS